MVSATDGLERLALGHGASQRPIDVLRQARALGFVVEGQRAEFVGHLLRGRGNVPLAERLTPVTHAANGSPDDAEPIR